MSMKIFLTGSTSYLGSKFIEMYGSKYDILGVSMNDSLNPLDLADKEKLNKIYNGFKPDAIIHLAADIGRDETTLSTITKTNPSIVQSLIELAQADKTPFVFTSSEAVYGGKWDAGDYKEEDTKLPRNLYGESKVLSEELLVSSRLPYLITRGHRYIGISSPAFSKKKQFPDALKAVVSSEPIHLDSKKTFTPALINNICDIIDYFLTNDINNKLILNVGINKKTTFYDLIRDVTSKLDLNTELIYNDGDEAGWPKNSSLNFEKLLSSNYPTVSYEEALEIIRSDFKKLNSK